MRSSSAGFAQLYYDIGLGVNETNSVRLQVEGGNRDVDYKFRLPEGTYSSLRFDPTDRPGNVMILSQLRIVNGAGQLVRAIEPNQVKASQQIERLETGPGNVSLTTASTADDPILALELREPLVLKSFARESWRTFTRRFLLSFPLASALGLLLAPALGLLAKVTALRWGAKMRTWSTNHPQRAVLLVAALSVILSCYPVVFFGKSFVSPNNHSHTFLLYGEMPTVPGYKEIATDDEKGSDLGAIMWQHWPYSVVQSRALFKDGELPLWNRYNSSGLPLLGQGQSMFGDPLHLLVLVAGGSSGSWDLKYLLAKFLFAACIGLCVLRAARHLPAALIIAATASFIGFFSYRYAHPAFFSLCYAPCILLCWLKLIDACPGRATAIWLGAMVLANWTVLNSGTVKEAYVLLLMMNFCGFLTLVLGNSIVGRREMKLFQALFANVLFLAIAMPVWFTFFHVLQNSRTSYDVGGAWQITPSLLIGLFDDIFYRQFNLDENHLDPSLNFLTLLAVLWFLFSPRRADPRGLSRGLTITSLVALAFVFAVVPAKWITLVPLLKSILHIDNTFSSVAIVCLLVLAGFGIKTFWNDSRSPDFKQTYLRVMVLFLGLIALYLGTTEAAMRSTIPMLHIGEHIPRSNFFWGYSFSLALAVALTPWLGRFALVTKRATIFTAVCLAMLFVLFHWRQGMHLATPFDAYVMNPQRRVQLEAESSSALKLVKARRTEPWRCAGLGSAFFPGYGGAVGIEQIDGPDGVLNKHYRALMNAFKVRLLFGGWRIGVIDERLAADLPLFNMLNVRYYLGYISPSVDLDPSLKKIASLDLDVFESERVWPRAYFSDEVVAYEQEEEFAAFLRSADGRPFAAIARQDLASHPELARLASAAIPSASRRITPANHYVLTNNSTSFKITVPGPGVIVLTECYASDDFELQINGKPSIYFRVNSAFKGAFLPAAGEYDVAFRYWPRYLTASLWTAGGGLALLLWWLAAVSKNTARP